MAGKPNDKMFKTMVEKHGSEEAARAWFRSIGSKGGKNGTTGGFAYMAKNDPERLKEVSAKGGKVKRGAK